ncbi:MAG: hypothetical protein OXE44_11165 [Nitrospinae bacterium]|nr:hypothetical protein [Nitrospinota bacterium]
MPIIDIFSRRMRRAEKTEPDVYQYDEIPETLRVQVYRIFSKSIGNSYYKLFNERNKIWDRLRETIAQELGRITIAHQDEPRKDCLHFLQSEQDIYQWMDLVELGMQAIDQDCRKYGFYDRPRWGITQIPDDAIKELNFRFRDARLGYQYENGQIVRIDNQLIHAEVTKPALQLLSDPRFKGAEEEFLKAHEHYRTREYEDCISNALKAFESTLKAICDLNSWEYSPGHRASDLLKVIRREKLLPDYLDTSFDQLYGTLHSGLPKVRNEAGGHGQGAVPRQTPDYIAAYALHLAASKIVLLLRAFQATESK